MPRVDLGTTEEHLELVEQLRAGGEPLEWEITRQQLWLYADRTLRSWFRAPSKLHRACREAGIPTAGLSDDDFYALHRDGDARTELANTVLVNAMPKFEQALRTSERGDVGFWDPELGRSLGSYFLGRCTQEVPGAARSWSSARNKSEARWASLSWEDWDEIPDGLDVANAAEVGSAARALWLNATDRQRPIVTLLWAGYSATDAAKELRMTDRAVEGQVRRLRQRAIRLNLDPWRAA